MDRSKQKGIQLHGQASFWYLEGFLGPERRRWRIPLENLPLRIGRLASVADVRLPSRQVSSLHARFSLRGRELRVRDLGSRNGTYLNGNRIVGERGIAAGDHVRFADLEFRLGLQSPGAQTHDRVDREVLEEYVAARSAELEQMLADGRSISHFQPIVSTDDGVRDGFELLSRGEIDGATASPTELFYLAERSGSEARLSRWFRERGLQSAERLERGARVFVNVHTAELEEPSRLADSLESARARAPQLDLVVEVRETALSRADVTRELRSAVRDLGLRLAIDDFGSGRKRLREISGAAPDYVKFDMSWVRGLHLAGHRRRRLRDLLSEARDLGITAVAEGVEDSDELEACRDVRFELVQGFFLGLPGPLDLSGETGEIEGGPGETEDEPAELERREAADA